MIWIITLVALIGTVLNVMQKRSGFILWVVADLALSFHNFNINEPAQGCLFLVYTGLAIMGFLSWGKKKELVVSKDGETLVNK